MNNATWIVALIAAYWWLGRRHLPDRAVFNMPANPEESDLYQDTVAALRSLGIKNAAAKKRVTTALQKHPRVTDAQELLKLCYEESK